MALSIKLFFLFVHLYVRLSNHPTVCPPFCIITGWLAERDKDYARELAIVKMVCKALLVHFMKVLKYSGYVLTVSELEKYMESVSPLTYLPVCIKSSVVKSRLAQSRCLFSSLCDKFAP
jgi:hypothetical protein